jgi:hypothetical protein
MEEQKQSWGCGTILAMPFALMAAIPIVIGAIIFAPVYIPLALLCGWLEGSDAKGKK